MTATSEARLASPRTLTAAALAAAGAAGLAGAAWLTNTPMLLLAGAGIAAATLFVAAAITDARRGILPNRLLAIAAAMLAVALPAHALLTGEPARIGQALIGGAAIAAIYLLIYAGRGAGAGDVKLATLIGFHTTYLSWYLGALAALAPYLLAIPAVIYFLARRQSTRRIPFGPFLAAGHLLALAAATI